MIYNLKIFCNFISVIANIKIKQSYIEIIWDEIIITICKNIRVYFKLQ